MQLILNLDWQTAVSLVIVGAAGVILVKKLVGTTLGSSAGGCGAGCGSCPINHTSQESSSSVKLIKLVKLGDKP